MSAAEQEVALLGPHHEAVERDQALELGQELCRHVGREERGPCARSCRDAMLDRERVLGRLVVLQELLEPLAPEVAARPLALPIGELQLETSETVELALPAVEAFLLHALHEVLSVVPGVG